MATENQRPLAHVQQRSFGAVTDTISAPVLTRPTSRRWLIVFGVACALMVLLLATVGYLLVAGVGIWGVNVPVGWGFDIVNFVWWIGIGHAGLLIAAVLLWRDDLNASIDRIAQAMALFAVACAGLFPLLHMGRPSLAYWLLPYPHTAGVWPQFRSPLVWDVFAVTALLLVSLLLWYIGMLPDLASLREGARSRVGAFAYGTLALGWRGDALHWHRHHVAQLLLASLIPPLVIVQTVTSFDFAAALMPGRFALFFPVHFLAVSLLSGLAMLLVVTIPLRIVHRLKEFITAGHLDNLARACAAAALLVGAGYLLEVIATGTYRFSILTHMFGPFAGASQGLLLAGVALPQLFWFPRMRSRAIVVWGIALLVLASTWLERYVVVVGSVQREFLPSSWGAYSPTVWDWAMFAGTVGLFLALVLLFARLLPLVPIFEMRSQLPEAEAPAEESERPERLSADRPADHSVSAIPGVYGVVAAFDAPAALLAAMRGVRQAGYEQIEACTPFRVPELRAALGRPRTWLPFIVLGAALVGAVTGYAVQYYAAVVDYPVNVGGRPIHGVGAFLVVTFQLAMIFAALAAALGMLALNGLPMPYHPLFHVEGFALASRDRFFLCIRSTDSRFDRQAMRRLLTDLQARDVCEAPS